MKTFVTHTHEIDHSNTTKKSYQNSESHQNYDHAENNLNENATVVELENQRDACEEELYRLRYGIEQLLATNDQSDFREQQQQRLRQTPSSMRTMSNQVNDSSDHNDDECSPCCRRYKGHRQDHGVNGAHDYTSRHVSQDRNYDSILHRTPEYSPRSQLYSDPFISPSSSPSIVSHNIHSTPSYSRRSPTSNNDRFTNQMTSNNINFSELILEAKAMDCLCTGYSKQNTERQISEALFELNQRVDRSKWSSPGSSSSRSMLSNYESSTPSPSSSAKLDERKKPTGSSEKDTLSVPKNRTKSSKSKTKSSKDRKKRSTSSRSHKKSSSSSKSHKKPSTSSKSHKKSSKSSKSHKKPSTSSRSHNKSHKSRSKKRKKSSKA